MDTQPCGEGWRGALVEADKRGQWETSVIVSKQKKNLYGVPPCFAINKT